jgi:hypothetical protein
MKKMRNQSENLYHNPFAQERTIVTEGFTIIEDGNGAVIINGYTLFGFVDRKECQRCGNTIRVLDFSFDQYFCPTCNVWEEPFCLDTTCRFCSGEHPPRPLPTAGEKDYPKRNANGWSGIKFLGIDI